jgi:YD repeat-containing protein
LLDHSDEEARAATVARHVPSAQKNPKAFGSKCEGIAPVLPEAAWRPVYDQSGGLIAVEMPGVYNPATSQIESPRYEYGYDAQGNQTLLRDPLGRETWFTFDAQNRCGASLTGPNKTTLAQWSQFLL